MHCSLGHPTFLRPHQPAVLLTHLPRDPMDLKWRIGKNPHGPVPKYGIRGIPTLMIFKGGDIVATKVGALSKSQLIEFLDANL